MPPGICWQDTKRVVFVGFAPFEGRKVCRSSVSRVVEIVWQFMGIVGVMAGAVAVTVWSRGYAGRGLEAELSGSSRSLVFGRRCSNGRMTKLSGWIFKAECFDFIGQKDGSSSFVSEQQVVVRC